jgi:hypothetical protein
VRNARSEEARLWGQDKVWTRPLILLLLAGAVLCFLAMGLGTPESPVFAETEFTQPATAGSLLASVLAARTAPTVTGQETAPEMGAAGWVHPPTTDETPPPGGSTSTTLPESTTTTLPADAATVDVDVVVYATQTSGLAAVRELALGAPHLRVALVSCGNLLETPLTQGLSVEDARNIQDVAGGFYGEWRQAVIRYYALRGLRSFTVSGRFVYEPHIAAQLLWSYVTGAAAPNVLFYSAKLMAASDEGDERYVDVHVEGAGLTRLCTRYFIDASVEGDLARMLGAGYRIGRAEDVYNDMAGNTPAYPSSANGWVTAPQRFSALLTLKAYAYGRAAPRIADLVHPNYDPSSYAGTTFAARNVVAFGDSWSMRIAVLPNSKRELNETWSDHPDIGLAFQWVFEPDKRGEIRTRVLQWTMNRARYLQENGYSWVGVDSIPQKLYVREGPRIIGLDTYTVSDLRAGTLREPVAVGCYCEYDRHDAFYPTHVETTRYVYMPMKALMADGHPALLMSTAVSTDSAAYCSAVRMEHTRANMGAAAAMIVIEAAESGVEPCDVSYQAVRAKLLARGYQLP